MFIFVSELTEPVGSCRARVDQRDSLGTTNAPNGLAVVQVMRGSCGGCFNKIPPQRQLDIVTKKKIIVCEHCGRVLVPQESTEA